MQRTCFIILMLLVQSILFADTEFELNGEHRTYFSVPLIKNHNDFNGTIKVPRLEHDLSVSIKHSTVSLLAGIRVTNKLTTSTMNDAVSFRPLENYLSLNTGKLQTILGFQEFAWGSADKLNPVDNINARDYTRGPDAEKLPLFSAAIKAYPTDRISVEAVYAPFDQADIFPVDAAEQIPLSLFSRSRISSIQLGSTGILTKTELVAGTKDVFVKNPAFDPSSFLTGVRLKTTRSSFDIAVSYLYDLDQFYTPEIRLESYSPVDMKTAVIPPLTTELLATSQPSKVYGLKNITLSRKRLHRFGLDAKTVIDRFGLWGEACFTLTEKVKNHPYESRNNQLDWTVGTDFTFGSSDQHYLNIQQIGRYYIDFDSDFGKRYSDKKPTTTDVIDSSAMSDFYYRLLTNRMAYATEALCTGIALRSELSFADGNVKQILEILYFCPFKYDDSVGKRYGDLYGTLKLDWKPVDAVLLGIGIQGFYSPIKAKGADYISNLEESKIGLFFPHSRIFIEGTFNWNR